MDALSLIIPDGTGTTLTFLNGTETTWTFLNGTETTPPDQTTTESPDDGEIPTLKKAHDGLVIIILVTVMYGMGCHITWKEVWHHLKRPVGVSVGMLSQFVLLPLSAFCLIKALSVPAAFAAGMLVLACCPGGVTSNLFSYVLAGNVSLSVTMTTCSTVVALGMMPFNMWLYGHSIQTDDLVIPYGKIAQSLVYITTPVIAGMLTRRFLPKVAPYMTKLGSYAGMCVIVIVQTMEIFIFPNLLTQVTWELYVAVCVLPVIGSALGYGAGRLFRQKADSCRTIAIESGIQNVGTALTIISLSFPLDKQEAVIVFPWLYAFTTLGMYGLLSLIYYLLKKYVWKEEDEEHTEKKEASTDDSTEGVKSTLGNGEAYDNLGFMAEGKYQQNTPV